MNEQLVLTILHDRFIYWFPGYQYKVAGFLGLSTYRKESMMHAATVCILKIGPDVQLKFHQPRNVARVHKYLCKVGYFDTYSKNFMLAPLCIYSVIYSYNILSVINTFRSKFNRKIIARTLFSTRSELPSDRTNVQWV